MDIVDLHSGDFNEEQFFFQDATLWGISSKEIGAVFCHFLNQSFRLDFERMLHLDVMKLAPIPKNTDIFTTASDANKYIYFPVFIHKKKTERARAVVYQNKVAGNVLIPNLKNFDFFLYIKHIPTNASLTRLDQLQQQLSFIEIVKTIDTSKTKGLSKLILDLE